MFAKITALWLKLSLSQRKEIISFLTTFASVFVLSVVTAFNADPSTLEAGAIAAVVIAAGRSALKAAVNAVFFPAQSGPNQA
jgi:hypothetical protein